VIALTATGLAGAMLFGANDTILASLVREDERQKTFGLAFTVLNLGIGVGGLAAGVFVDAHRPITFQIIYLANAGLTLVPGAILLALPHVGRAVAAAPSTTDTPAAGAADHGSGGYRRVLRDRPFVALIAFGLVLATVGYAQIEVGFTAFAIGVAQVPARVIAFSFAANTAVIVVCQLFVLRWLEGRSRTRALAMVGVIFAVAWSILAVAGWAGAHGHATFAAIAVIAFGAIFAVGETMMTPVLPTITNALAPDELRGRYNAMAGMVFGLSGVIGPATAGPLIGGGQGSLWVMLIIGGSLVAAGMALWLRRQFTPAQDGRVVTSSTAVAEPVPVEEPVAA
jgi:MFS family permease